MTRTVLNAIIGDGVVWDNHACMPLRPGDESYLPMLEICHAAGVDVITLNVGFGEQGVADHIVVLATFRRWIAERSDRYLLVAGVADVAEAKATGRLGVCFDIEGMNALCGQLDMVSLYYDLGVRWMLAAYNRANAVGGGCMDPADGGLTEFGRHVIGEMNRVGMVVCGSHTGYRTAREMIDLSADPVIFSHSNPRAVWDNPRNIPDDLMVACAARGGVIGLNGIGLFLGLNDVHTETFVAHVEYALDLIGENHVGLGLDYVFDQNELTELIAANPALFPAAQGYGDGMKMINPARLGEIAEALAARGHSTSTLSKLFGGNHLRIAETVWRPVDPISDDANHEARRRD